MTLRIRKGLIAPLKVPKYACMRKIFLSLHPDWGIHYGFNRRPSLLHNNHLQ